MSGLKKKATSMIAEGQKTQEKPEPLIPDYDSLQMAARRRAARRKGGRASTVLSEDRLGP